MNLPKASLTECFLVYRHIQVIVFDVEGAVIQVKRPLDRHTLLPISRHARLEAIFAIGGGSGECQSRVAIDGDKTAPDFSERAIPSHIA